MKYVEISTCGQDQYWKASEDASCVETLKFKAEQIGDIDFQFEFDYTVPTKKVKLNLLQIHDLINFYKVYTDIHSDWVDKSTVFMKLEDISKV